MIPHFDSASDLPSRRAFFQRGQKSREPVEIHFESRGELEQNGTETFLQVLGTREKHVQRLFRIFQAFDMSQEPACFDRKNELGWNLDAPVLECGFSWEPVKTVVDFDGAKIPGKKLQPVPRLEIARIKLIIPPVFVVPAARTDEFPASMLRTN